MTYACCTRKACSKDDDMAKPATTHVEKHIRSLFPDDVISRVQVLE